MASCTGAGVIVWEWFSEIGRWVPHEPHVSDFLENAYEVFCRTAIVGNRLNFPGPAVNWRTPADQLPLAGIDNSLAGVVVDFPRMLQISNVGNVSQVIRRNIYSMDSPAGKGIVWQWSENSSGQAPCWHSYDLEIAGHIEQAFCARVSSVDLKQTSCQSQYLIDLVNMKQIRSETGFSRPIQRIRSAGQYTKIIQTLTASNNNQQTSANSLASQSLNPAHNVKYSVRSSAGGPAALPMMMPPGLLVHNPQLSFINLMHPSLQSSGLSSQTPVPNANFSALSAPAGNAQSIINSLPNAISSFQSGASSLPLVVSSALNPVAGTSFNSIGQLGSQIRHDILKASRHSTRRGRGVSPTDSFGGNRSADHGAVMVTSKPGARTSNLMSTAKRLKTSDEPSLQDNSNMNDAERLLQNYVIVVDSPSSDEECCICQGNLNELSAYESPTFSQTEKCKVIKLGQCNHMFHKLCLLEMYKSGTKDGSLQCPTCKKIYGTKMGICPPGYMSDCIIDHCLPGYEGYRTIKISYMILPGIQGPEHPNPGQKFSARGFPRHGYLPDNHEGRQALKLLKIAWERRLTFTVGTSVTTGESDTVVWNEIHHKTEVQNLLGHGYPDPNYLPNVISELAAQGVKED